jgi:hypothetical protein
MHVNVNVNVNACVCVCVCVPVVLWMCERVCMRCVEQDALQAYEVARLKILYRHGAFVEHKGRCRIHYKVLYRVWVEAEAEVIPSFFGALDAKLIEEERQKRFVLSHAFATHTHITIHHANTCNPSIHPCPCKHVHTNVHIQRHIAPALAHIHRHINVRSCTHTHEQTNTHTHTHTQRHTPNAIHTDRQEHTHTHTQTDRQTDIQTDRQRHTHAQNLSEPPLTVVPLRRSCTLCLLFFAGWTNTNLGRASYERAERSC